MTARNDLNVNNFWTKVAVSERNDECWEWKLSCDSYGYGHLKWGGILRLSHRLAWELTNGEIPDNLQVLHTCDNPKCCNPKHLFLGTHLQNMQDKNRKGRQSKGIFHPKHKLTPELVKQVRTRNANGDSHEKLAKELGLHHSTISQVVLRKTWKEVE